MEVEERKNLLEVWDALCELVNEKGKIVEMKPPTKPSANLSFNQIRLNLETPFWQAMLDLLDPLSEEETKVLLDLSNTNERHNVYQSKVSIAMLITIPIGIVYITNFIIQSFDLSNSTALMGGAIGGLIGGVIGGGYFLYKQLSNRWLSMEVTTCLETALAMKKAERVKFKKIELPVSEDVKSKASIKKTPIKIFTKK